jgi:hypothetical protein
MDPQSIKLARWAVSIGVPALAGLAGVVIGAWLAGRRERNQRRLAFVEQQLKDFYSPMLGLRTEVRMRSELRVRIHDNADVVWRELCADARQVSVEALGDISRTRGPEFKKVIDYDNKQLQEELLPAYSEMAKLFRENLWLADPDTREHYQQLIEFVELWDRWLANSIPAEVIERLGHSEENLKPFYKHLQERHDDLRTKIKQGKA